MNKILYIPPDDLIVHKTVRMEKAYRYAAEMLAGAQFPPIRAYRRHFGEPWRITDGSHRATACKILNRLVKVETRSKLYFPEEYDLSCK